MKKVQLPLIAELNLTDTNRSTSRIPREFAGTKNVRALRVIQALSVRPRKREEIDRIAGASNGPDLIADLRRLGLELPCTKVPAVDRDGQYIRHGVYQFSSADYDKVRAWLCTPKKGEKC